MKYKPVILLAAKEDLQRAAKWYNQAQPGLGKELVAGFRLRLSEIRTNPFTCQIKYSEVHTALVDQFPYMIHYFVGELPIHANGDGMGFGFHRLVLHC